MEDIYNCLSIANKCIDTWRQQVVPVDEDDSHCYTRNKAHCTMTKQTANNIALVNELLFNMRLTHTLYLLTYILTYLLIKINMAVWTNQHSCLEMFVRWRIHSHRWYTAGWRYNCSREGKLSNTCQRVWLKY